MALWVIGGTGTLVTLAISAVAWSQVNTPIAVHFGPDGPDRYAGRAFGLLAVPITVLAGTVVMSASVWLSARPHRGRRSSEATPAAWLVVVALLTCIHVSMIVSAI